MIAAVSVGFRVTDIILFPQNLNTRNLADEADRLVNILDKGAYQTYPCGIPHILEGAVRCDGEVLPLQLCPHAFRPLDSGLERGNRVTMPPADLIAANHLETGKKFLNRAFQKNQVVSIKKPFCTGDLKR